MVNGKATPLAPGAVANAARQIGCEAAVLEAVIAVEASGRWFNRDGSLPHRFEPASLPPKVQNRIAWSGGWKEAAKLSSSARLRLYETVAEFDPEAAADASSYGGPQIMGFNAETVGYGSAVEMMEAFADGAQHQLDAMVRFLERTGLFSALRAKDWETIARVYNGPGQVAVYAAKMESAYKRLTGESSPPVLRVGDRGEAVARAQEAMGMEPDGVFGPDTLSRTKEFQRARGLADDGIIGAKTWEAMAVEPGRKEDELDRNLKKIRDVAATAGAVSAALTGVMENIPEVGQTIIWVAVGVSMVIAVGAWSYRTIKMKDVTA